MGCAVSIVHSCRASQGSSGRLMLVAKSLAVPIGTTAIARDIGAFSLTRALATCRPVADHIHRAGMQASQQVPSVSCGILYQQSRLSGKQTWIRFGCHAGKWSLWSLHNTLLVVPAAVYLVYSAISTSSDHNVYSAQSQGLFNISFSISLFPCHSDINLMTLIPGWWQTLSCRQYSVFMKLDHNLTSGA